MRGKSVYKDEDDKEYLGAAAGLWCASLGFGVERLAKVAYDQMCKVGYYHIYRSSSNETAIELAAKLLEIAPVPHVEGVPPVLWLRGERHSDQDCLVLLARLREA